MNLQKNMGEKGVSPVIGTILLIAITVIVAGSIGYMVYGMTGQTQAAPTASLSVEKSSGDYQLYHNGGDNLDIGDLRISVAENSIEGVIQDNMSISSLAVGESINLSTAIDNMTDVSIKNNRVLIVHDPSESILLDTTP